MNNKSKKKQITGLLFLFLYCIRILCVCVYANNVDDYALTINEENKNTDQSKNESEGDISALDIASPSAVLMEASTGTIICDKNANERRSPASITKIMTLLLIFESLEKGELSLSDEVVTSAYAKSMIGSKAFLEEEEVQSVDTMIKCIAVASANDASVAMAEKIAQSEDAFVELMNKKARELGMENTHFEDCCGLSDSPNHYTSARDVAIMARELITKYPEIFEYSKIWMEDITHVTRQGSKIFTLSSTNKMLKQYPYATGLKTGSTSFAKYCFCGTARKNDMDLIAVVMAAPDHKVRFSDAKKLLEYGYSVSKMYKDSLKGMENDVKVRGGIEDMVKVSPQDDFVYLDITGKDLSKINKETYMDEPLQAPIATGEKVGSIKYFLGQEAIGEVSIVALESVREAFYKDVLYKTILKFCV